MLLLIIFVAETRTAPYVAMSFTEAKYQFIAAMCLNTAAHLGIPQKASIHGRPITLPDLATALHLHPTRTDALNQLMRFLISKGLFSITRINEEEDAYVLAPSSHLLLTDMEAIITTAMSSPASVLGPFEPFHAALLFAWKNLGDWFRGDEAVAPFKFAHGISFWDYLKGSPDGYVFHETMEKDSKRFIESSDFKKCVAAFEGLESMVDVGGGTGAMAKTIAETYPLMKCKVFDLPQVMENITELTQGNLSFVGGDVFHCVPTADAVLMKWVLHDWGDEKCLLILKNAKEAISHKGKEGKIIIIDIVLYEENEAMEATKVKLVFDMTMMIAYGGKERSEREWHKLIKAAGFSHYRRTPLSDFRSLIELFP